jgi:hypothetical protein
VKHTIDDLAIFGGSPAFSEKLFVGRPNIDGSAVPEPTSFVMLLRSAARQRLGKSE